MRGLRRGAAAVVLLWAAVALFWAEAPFALCFDDAFYYFRIAQQILAGNGSTFDGQNLTNGYHPLWMLACLPAFGLFPPEAAIRLLLAAQVALWAGALWRLPGVRGPGDRGIGAASVLIVGLAPGLIQVGVNGLESALAGFLLSVALGALWRSSPEVPPDRLGWLLPLCFLARTDAVFLAAALLLTGPGAWRARARLLLPFGATVAAFLWFNHAWFGTATQISGSIKRLPLEGWRIGAWFALWGGASLALGRVRALQIGAGGFLRARRYLAQTRAFGVYAAMGAGYYLFLQAFPQLWYFGPALLYALGLLACVAEDLQEQAERERPGGGRVIALLLLGPLAGLAIWQGARFVDPQTRAAMRADRAAAEWAAEHLPAGAVIGSWDAGVIGFYAQHPVINLDGLVNSASYRDHAAAGTAGPWLQAQGLSVLINHDRLEDGEPRTIRDSAARLLAPEGGLTLTEIRREAYTFKGASNRWGPGLHPMATVALEIGWPEIRGPEVGSPALPHPAAP